MEKTRWSLMPWPAIEQLAIVLTRGEAKHPSGPWRSMSRDQHFDAALRHLIAWRGGTKIDPEFGQSHLVHALARIAFLYCVDTGRHDDVR